MCAKSYPFVQFKISVYGLTDGRPDIHASCNAVTLVWGSLRLAPIITNVRPQSRPQSTVLPSAIQIAWVRVYTRLSLSKSRGTRLEYQEAKLANRMPDFLVLTFQCNLIGGAEAKTLDFNCEPMLPGFFKRKSKTL